jgi:Arc/MetJ-type ribon-helix-helix transcriptional regulator
MAESEKITINMNPVELGTVDLLVEQGFYSNRTDFIRTAIRNLLGSHADEVKQAISRKSFAVGIVGFGRAELEAARDAGKMVDIKVLGLACIHNDVSPELARETIQSLDVSGGVRAPRSVLDALADRMGRNGFFRRAS